MDTQRRRWLPGAAAAVAIVTTLAVPAARQLPPPPPPPPPPPTMTTVSTVGGGAVTTTTMVGPSVLTVPQSGTGILVGRVLEAESNRPVAGAIVSFGAGALGPPAPGAVPLAPRLDTMQGAFISSGRPAVPRVLTDTEGRFAFRNLPAGAFILTATRPGFADGAYRRVRAGGPMQPVTLADGERKTDVTLRVFKHGAISGRVIDDLGEPAVGVQVRAFRRTLVAGQRRLTPVSQNTYADDRGVYRVSNLAPGDYVICALFSTQSAAVGFTSSPDFIATVMTPGSAGYSVTSNGTRVAGTDAFVLQSAFGLITAAVDANSRPVGYANVCHPTSPSVSAATAITIAPGAERTGIDLPLRLVPLVMLSGTLTGPEGPAANYVLHLVASDSGELSSDPDIATAITAADGSFMFLGVPAGQYVIQTVRVPRAAVPAGARSGGSGAAPPPPPLPAPPVGPGPVPQSTTTLWTATPVSVGRTDINGLSIALQRGATVAGKVDFEGAKARPEGQALSAITVVLEPADGKPRANTTPTRLSPDGSFVTQGVPAGRYLVRSNTALSGWMLKAVMAGGVDASETPLDLGRGDIGGVTVIFTDRVTRLSGTVRAPTSGTDEGTAVVVFPSDSDGWRQYGINPRRMRLSRASPIGEFSFTGLPAGEYYLAAIDDAVAGEWQDPRFLTALARQAARVMLGDGAQMTQSLDRLNIRLPAGGLPAPVAVAAPLAGAASRASVDDDRPHGPMVRDESVPHIADGRQQRDTIAGPSRGTSSLSGTVVLDTTSAEPVRRARVSVRLANSNYDYSTLTDEKGLWRIDGLPAGRYSVSVTKPAHITAYYGSTRPGRPPGSAVAIAAGARVENLMIRLQPGAVIAGTVTDESGQPVSGASLRVWQVLTAGGERRLVAAAGGGPFQVATNDLGEYRVFGLSEGTYYVSATVTAQAAPEIRQQSGDDLRAIINEASRAPAPAPASSTSAPPAFQPMAGRAVGFAPVFHPSSVMVDAAAGVVVSAGMERLGVDIVVRMVPTSVIRGRVMGPDGQPATQARVMLATYESGGISIGGFSQFGLTVQADGSFATASVPPGRYTVWARGAPAGTAPTTGSVPTNTLPLFAAQDVEVHGEDLSDVVLTLQEGSSVSGRVVFEGDGPTPDPATIRVSLSATNPNRMAAGGASASPGTDGTFTLTNVPPGEYRASAFLGAAVFVPGAPTRWTLKSFRYQDRDLVDVPFAVGRGQDIDGVTATFTNRMPELSGTITDATGRPVPDLTIVLFSTNRADWRQASRRVLSPVQPDSTGRFVFSPVPAGEYFLAAVASADRNDLADVAFLETVAPAAIRVTIGDGERKVQDLRVAGGK